MNKTIVLFLIIFAISGCSTVEKYMLKITHKPTLLIGYKKVGLRENIPPVVDVMFASNESTVSAEYIEKIKKYISGNSYYVVETTAGGFTNGAQSLAQERAHTLIKILEANGVKSSDIYIAEYMAAKPGRHGYIYSITFQ